MDDLRIQAGNNPKAFTYTGKTIANLFNNAGKARERNRISQEVYERLLREENGITSHEFRGS